MSEKISEADQIWEQIKKLDLGIFALKNQLVEMHMTRLPISGDVVYVKLHSSAVLPALEEVLGKDFEVEVSEGYTIIRRASDQGAEVEKALKQLEAKEMLDRAEAAVFKNNS